MDYKYTQNPNAEQPIMLVDKYIGRDADGVMGVDGAQFARELISLKNAGKTSIEIWINSKGGNVAEGYSIYSALQSMTNDGMNVKTVNMGVVDSTAGWIFQAGTERVWMPHSLGLMHNASRANGETIEEMNGSIATMLASRAKIGVDKVRELMAANTILNAKRADEYGLCDLIPNTGKGLHAYSNSSSMMSVLEASNMGADAITTALKTAIIQPRNNTVMNINTVLGLANEASPEAQYAAINALVEAKNAAETQVTALSGKVDTLTSTLTTTTEQLSTATTKLTEMENANNLAKAKDLVKPHVGVRITDDAAIVAKWEGMALNDYEGTKVILESLNVNRQAPKSPVKPAGAAESKVITSVSDYMLAPNKRQP